MRAWFFSENAYHLLPPAEEYDSIFRVVTQAIAPEV